MRRLYLSSTQKHEYMFRLEELLRELDSITITEWVKQEHVAAVVNEVKYDLKQIITDFRVDTQAVDDVTGEKECKAPSGNLRETKSLSPVTRLKLKLKAASSLLRAHSWSARR